MIDQKPDEMPAKLYASKQFGGTVGFEPFAGATEYTRADLCAADKPAVDLKMVREALTSAQEFCIAKGSTRAKEMREAIAHIDSVTGGGND